MSNTTPDASGQSGVDPTPGGTSSGDGSTPGSEGSGAERTFTQEQVARIIADERRKATAPYGDYDEVKSKLAKIEAASQTELERAQAQAKEADTRAGEATAQRNRLLVTSAVTSAAARAGALDPDVVVALLADSVSVDDGGAIEGDVSALVAKLLEDKPFLKNGSSTSGIGSADQGAHSPRQATGSSPNQTMDNVLRSTRQGGRP